MNTPTDAEPWGDIRLAIREPDVIAAAQTLLRLAVRHETGYGAAVSMLPGKAALRGIHDTALEVLETHGDPRLTPTVWPKLEEIVTASKGQHPAIVLRGLLLAIDSFYGKHMVDWFRRHGPELVKGGEVVPTIRPNLGRYQPKTLSTNPARFEEHEVDRIPNLRLLPEGGPAVHLDFAAHGALSKWRPHGYTTVASIHPNSSVEDFEWDENLDEKKFFNVRPKNPQRQRDEVCDLVKRAVAEGADVVVVPELSVPDVHVNDVVAAAGNDTIIVAGSCHIDAADGRLNQYTVGFPDGVVATGTKLNAYRHTTPEGVKLTEDITVPTVPAVRVFYGPTQTCCVLICIDYIFPRLGRLVADLGVGLVLVPAMSDKVQLFEAGAAIGAGNVQCVTVIANTPSSPARTIGIVGHPLRESLYTQVISDGDPPAGDTGLALYDVTRGGYRWIGTGMPVATGTGP